MHTLLRIIGAVVLLVLIALLLSPGGTIDAERLIWDKAAHFIAFGLILWSFGVLFRRMLRAWAALLAVGLGAAVEVVQGYIGRDANWGDLLADTLGVATALLIWVVWRRFRTREAFQVPDA
jgi:VanZ family protein